MHCAAVDADERPAERQHGDELVEAAGLRRDQRHLGADARGDRGGALIVSGVAWIVLCARRPEQDDAQVLPRENSRQLDEFLHRPQPDALARADVQRDPALAAGKARKAAAPLGHAFGRGKYPHRSRRLVRIERGGELRQHFDLVQLMVRRRR